MRFRTFHGWFGDKRLARLATLPVALVLIGACVAGPMLPGGTREVQRSSEQSGPDTMRPQGFPGARAPIATTAPPAVFGSSTVRRAPGSDRAVKVALLLPLTGPQAPIGRDLMDAAQIGLFEVAGSNFQLLPHDTGGTPRGAARAAQAAMSDGAQLILGPLLSASVSAVAPIARSRGVPVVAFSNDLTVAGNGVYTMGFVPQDQVLRVIDYARTQGMTRFASLVPDNAYGIAMAETLQRSLPRFGTQIANIKFYTFGDPAAREAIGRGVRAPVLEADQAVRELADFDRRVRLLDRRRATLEADGSDEALAELKRLENFQTKDDPEFDAVFLPAGGDDILRLAPLLAFYDVDPAKIRFLGTWLWDDADLGAESTMVGAWFAAPPPRARANFLNNFRQTYGREPDRRATVAFDALAMAAILAARTDSRYPYSQRTLTGPNGFVGTDGIFRLLPSGVVERGLAVLEITREGVTVLDPAPRNFDELRRLSERRLANDRRRFIRSPIR